MIDIVDFALTVAKADQRLNDGQNVFFTQSADSVFAFEIEPHIHLHATDRREIIALWIEEQAVEQRLSGLRRRRLARTHHPVDVDQSFVRVVRLVDFERVANERTGIDMVDVENGQLFQTNLAKGRGHLLGDFIAGFAVDLARLHIDDVFGKITGNQLGIGNQKFLETFRRQLVYEARCDLAAGFDNHIAGLGVDQIARRLHAAQPVGHEGHPPALFRLLEHDRIVEDVEDFLVIMPERIEKCRYRQFAPTVDTNEHDVLGVEFEIEPGTAIGNDARGEQQLSARMRLAAVVVEQHAG